MNQLIPIHKENFLYSTNEEGPTKFNNRFFILTIFFVFLFLIKSKKFQPYSKKSLGTIENISNSLDQKTLDKASLFLEKLKKVTTINDISKNLFQSNTIPGKLNMNKFKELMDILEDTLGENYKPQIQNMTQMISMVEKAKDIKKIMEVQKSFTSQNNGDMMSQINHMIQLISPLLPEEQIKNIDQFKKMAQMIKLMSLFEGNTDETQEDQKSTEG